jgi:hypothetical protein
MIQVLLALILLFGLSSCAPSRGFDREAMQDMLRSEPDVVTEGDIGGALDRQADIPMPFRLAVFFTSQHAPFEASVQRPNWLAADKERILNSVQPLKKDNLIDMAFILADSAVQGRSNRDIRLAAARYNADLVLVVNGAAAVDRYNNGYAAWYATILGIYLAPGTHSDALFMVEGTLWDTRTGFLYGTQTAEGTAHSVGPAAWLDDKEVVARAKQEALQSFGEQAADLLRLTKERFHRPTPARGG